MSNKLNDIVEIAQIANLLVKVATSAGIPVITLVTTIAANYKKGDEITAMDIANSVSAAKKANDSLGRAIEKRRTK